MTGTKNCPRCGFSNPSDMNFCLNCGQNLKKSRNYAGLILLFAGGVLFVGLALIIGVIAVVVNSIIKDNQNNRNDNNHSFNRQIALPSPSAWTNLNKNDNPKNANLAAINRNSLANDIPANKQPSPLDSDKKIYRGLAEGKNVKDVRQPQVGEWRLINYKPSEYFNTAAEREDWIYVNSKNKRLYVTCALYNNGSDARKTLRETIQIFKSQGDNTSEINDCVNRADSSALLGITASLYQKTEKVYRVYWTDGSFLFVVSNPDGTKDAPFDWMQHSSY
jgi:hypothetical protein